MNDRALSDLNYHHLRYFWRVARVGNLTQAAKALHVSQSALSTQIRQLESQLETPLFDRVGRRLVLTEAGHLVFHYAEDIFSAGEELLATLAHGRGPDAVLTIGGVATLSRNFQDSFIGPLMDRGADAKLAAPRLRLVSGRFLELLERLQRHELDLVLANQPARGTPAAALRSHRLARQPVSLVASPEQPSLSFPDGVSDVPLILPGRESAVRTSFDALCERVGVSVRVVAEVEDMAMMRLLARDMKAVALMPNVVVRDELRQGVLRECCVVPDLYEDFYAITGQRRYGHRLVQSLLSRSEAEILAMGLGDVAGLA